MTSSLVSRFFFSTYSTHILGPSVVYVAVHLFLLSIFFLGNMRVLILIRAPSAAERAAFRGRTSSGESGLVHVGSRHAPIDIRRQL